MKNIGFIILAFIAIPTIYCLPAAIVHIFDEFTANTGAIGDTIGGTTAPIIGLISIILLYKTLKEQISFNAAQAKYNKEQLQIQKDEQFRNVFLQLLQEQRDILQTLEITSFQLESKPMDATVKEQTLLGLNVLQAASRELECIYDCIDTSDYYDIEDSNDARVEYEQIVQEINAVKYDDTIDEGLKSRKLSRLYSEEKQCKDIISKGFYFDKFDFSSTDVHLLQTWPEPDIIEFVSEKLFAQYNDCLHYFGNLFRILDLIKTNEAKELERCDKATADSVKKKYSDCAKLLQSQMSNTELRLVYYSCFIFPEAKKLVSHYNLLDTLSIDLLISPSHNCYPKVYIFAKSRN